MRGPVSLNVSDNKVEYSIKLYHNISILTGDGGKGKSSLINLILRALQKDGFTKLDSDVEVRVLDMISYFYFLRETPNKKDRVLYVIDEEVLRVQKQNFINKVYDTGCFFLFITRALQRINLLISTDAIYRLNTVKDSSKYKNTLKLLYEKHIGVVKPVSEIITEDKVSAPDILRKIGYTRITPAGSNTQVTVKLNGSKHKHIAILVDLVAFGKNVPEVLSLSRDKDICIADCKSLEHILLHNQAFIDIQPKLDYKNCTCDFSKFKSLERYYTDLLVNEAKRVFNYDYNKSEVPEFLIDDRVKELVYEILGGA